MATNENNESNLPEEILLKILSYHLLPSAVIIGRQRYEDINVPRGPIIKDGMIKSYSDNDLHTGACMHQHEEWRLRLRTLSASAKTSRQFHRLTVSLLYQVFPGQTLVKPQLFLRTLKERPDLALLVKEVVLDPWDAFNVSKDFTAAFNALMVRSPEYSALELLERTAKTWNDEPHALLLLFNCPQIHTLSLITPPVAGDNAAMSSLLNQLQRLGPNTLARTRSEAINLKTTISSLPLRQLKTLSLHHAEHHYLRKLEPLAPFLRLLTLRSLTIHRFWSGAEVLANAGHVHHLTLWRCSLESEKLLRALRRCRELRSLNLIFPGCTSMLGKLRPVTDHVDVKKLGDVIRTQLTNLKMLRLDDREVDVLRPSALGSLRDGPALEELAVNEGCLGAYLDDGKGDVATPRLADMLPPSLRRLIIFRTNLWWHQADRGFQNDEYTRDGATFRVNAMREKVVQMLRSDLGMVPELEVIHIDTPLEFGRDVERFGWRDERVVGDEMVARPSIVADSLMKPEEKRGWEKTQEERAMKPSVVLRRMRGRITT